MLAVEPRSSVRPEVGEAVGAKCRSVISDVGLKRLRGCELVDRPNPERAVFGLQLDNMGSQGSPSKYGLDVTVLKPIKILAQQVFVW
jgi:hypothetical protein